MRTLLRSLGCLLALAACAPALNWREIRPDDAGGALAMFPCKPSHEVREVTLGGSPVRLAVTACRAGDAMFALAAADVRDPARVGEALLAMRDAAVANVQGRIANSQAAQVPGMTPHPSAQVHDVAGRMPGGAELRERLAVFSRGTWVFQATMFGPTLDAEAADTFFGGLRLP